MSTKHRIVILATLAAFVAWHVAAAVIVIRGPRIAAGGTPTYHENFDAGLVDDDNYLGDTLTFASKLTLPAAGTVTEVAVYISIVGSTTTLKIGLVDSGKNTLAHGSVSVSATGWATVALSQPVTATDYYINFVPAVDAALAAQRDNGSTSGLGMADLGVGYAGFPPGNSGYSDLTQRWRVRVLLAP